MESQQQHPATPRSSNVAEIVAIFLGVTRLKQKSLMVPLGLSESQVSRKMKTGTWTVDEVDTLAQFFGVAVSDFFEDPEVIRRRTLGISPSPWMPITAGQLALDLTESQVGLDQDPDPVLVDAA